MVSFFFEDAASPSLDEVDNLTSMLTAHIIRNMILSIIVLFNMQEGLARAETIGSGKASSEPKAALVPARLERLPWGRFHTLIVIALGVTWILDGLEVTLAGAVAGASTRGAAGQ